MTEYRCRKCGEVFAPTVSQISKHDYHCKPCRKKDTRARNLARKAAGLRVSGKKMPREYFQAYNETYKARPEVRSRRAKRFRERAKCPEERGKMLARQQARNAIRRGDLRPLPCEVCGTKTVDAHHDDYSRPLDVRWLCRLHHHLHHLSVSKREAHDV